VKVKCVQDCNGTGYEHFKKGQERELSENTAKKLIEFGYAESLEPAKDQYREALINKFKELGLIGETEKMDTNIIEDCIYDFKNSKNGNENYLPAGDIKTDLENPSEINTEETEEEKRARLISKAEELGIKGVLSNFKDETLEKKIAEAEATK